MTAKVSLQDLLPGGDELYEQALGSLCGDPAWHNDGVHSGRNPYREGSQGLTKLDVLQRLQDKDLAWFDDLAASVRQNPCRLPPS